MPNWCSNNLYIKGDPTDVANFIQRVRLSKEEQEKRGQEYDILGQLYPTPKELMDTKSGFFGKDETEKQAELETKQAENIAKYGQKDWYDWQYAKWGTKWGDCDTYLSGVEGYSQVEFGFTSAWSPPIEGIAHITTLFPTLEFALAYTEEGMDFYGLTTFDNGDVCDVCEHISELDGMKAIDWDSDDCHEVMDNNHDILLNAHEKLLTESGF